MVQVERDIKDPLIPNKVHSNKEIHGSGVSSISESFFLCLATRGAFVCSLFPLNNWNIPSCNFLPWRSQMPSRPFPEFSIIKTGKEDAFTLRIPDATCLCFQQFSQSLPCPDYQDLRPWDIFGDNTTPSCQSIQQRVLTLQPMPPNQ